MKNALTYPACSGFESLFDALWAETTDQGFPYYDVVKSGPTTYIVSLAVAGFSRNDLSVSVEDGVLTIKGTKPTKSDTTQKGEYDAVKYLHKGIAQRSFTKQFILEPSMKVVDSYIEDGVLSVEVEKQVPEWQKPRKIEVKSK